MLAPSFRFLIGREDGWTTFAERLQETGPVMSAIVFTFSSSATANFLVAGVPSAARAIREVQQAIDAGLVIRQVFVAVPGGWIPSDFCAAEMARLGSGLSISVVDSLALTAAQDLLFLRGEELLPSARIVDLAMPQANLPRSPPDRNFARQGMATTNNTSIKQVIAELATKGEAIIMATAKPADGIVSRHINRPISRAISRSLLRIEGVKPVHATIAAAATGIVMAACLLFGGLIGLMSGAVLFQIASIIDGVDGEIARATHRTSLAGAKLDSLTDAATNLAFVAGVSVNLWLREVENAAVAGLIGLAILTTGTILLGMRAQAGGGAFTFDAVKDHVRKKPSLPMQILTWITMRDFYAAAAALVILAGYAEQAMFVFAAVAAGWLVFVSSVLYRTK